MHIYQIYPVDADGVILARYDILCESDHEALAFASWMVEAGLPAEVWRDGRIVDTVSGGHDWGVCFELPSRRSAAAFVMRSAGMGEPGLN